MESMRDTVEAAKGGDPDACEVLLELHLSALRAFVRLRLGAGLRAKETSLDLVQSVCREALADLSGFEYRGDASFRHWLFRRAENKIKDRVRFWGREKRSSEREVHLDAPDREGTSEDVLGALHSFYTPSRHASAREELERVEAAFRELPPDYREVITLSRLVGLRHEDVAREMGRTTSATRTLLSRALARLATQLGTD